MRVVIVTGIFPPDIGGPATHASDLRDALLERGHQVVVLTLGEAAGMTREPGLVRWPRSWPWPRRHAAIVRWIVANRRRIDAIYATGMHPAAVAGARLAGLPSVVKIVGDPVWERGRRQGLTEAEFEVFRASTGKGRALAMMRLVRNSSLRSASRIVTPSTALSRDVEAWLGGPADITVIPNGVAVPERSTLDPGRPSSDRLSLVFVGRLVDVKRVDRIVRAVAMTEGVRLTIIGSGPELGTIERAIASAPSPEEFTLQPALPHEVVLQRIAAADALVLASDTEGLPHVVLEALTVGTPVVAPSVGGIPEVVRNEREGLLLDDVSEERLAAAFRRLRDEPGLLERLGTGAFEAGRGWRFEATADAVLAVVDAAIRKRPHVVLVGKTGLVRGDRELEARVSLMQRGSDITLVQTGAVKQAGIHWVGTTPAVVFPAFRPKAVASLLFYSVGPLVAVGASWRKHGSNVVMPQSPFEAVMAIVASRAVPRRARPKVVVQVHGDWRTAAGLYGSASRRWVAPIANALAGWALRHADRVRAIGSYTESLVREVGYHGPIDTFPTFRDFTPFLETRLMEAPSRPVVTFLGGSARVKGLDVLRAAWSQVERDRPDATLVVGGSGITSLYASGRPRVRALGPVPSDGVLEVLDRSSFVVMPSRSEGLGRLALEAQARSRAVIASDVGGLSEVVTEGEDGLLVPPEDPDALAAAILKLIEDPHLAEAMGRRGRRKLEASDPSGAFDRGFEDLAVWAAR